MPAFLNSKYEVQLEFYKDGAVVNVSAYAFGMEWYRASDRKLIVKLTQGSGINVTNAATGIIVITLTPAQVDDIGAGMARVLLYRDYSNNTTRQLIQEGSESIEGLFDAQ